MQIIQILYTNRENLEGAATMPEPYGPLLENLSILALDVVQFVPFSCMYRPLDHFDALFVATVSPICFLVTVMCGARLYRYYRDPEQKGIVDPHLENKIASMFLQAALVILPATSVRIARSFRCDNFDCDLDGDNCEYAYLTADYWVDCDTKRFDAMIVYALFMVIVFPVPTCMHTLHTPCPL